MSSGLMNTEPGGEGDQYQPETQPDAVNQQQEQSKADRGVRTAENIRYGQTISEGGMGGMTTEAGGSANQGSSSPSQWIQDSSDVPLMVDLIGGYGSIDTQSNQDGAEASREAQGYSTGGSGVGA
ncbi:MAG: hypothetical protein Q9177_000191 [Variospora cf. flavescens]